MREIIDWKVLPGESAANQHGEVVCKLTTGEKKEELQDRAEDQVVEMKRSWTSGRR